VLNNVVESPLELQDGGFVPPKEPGLGIVFDGLEQYDKEESGVATESFVRVFS